MDNEQLKTKVISKRLLAFNAVVVFLILILTFAIFSVFSKNPVSNKLDSSDKIASRVFDKVSLEAKSIYVYDVKEDRVIYKKNEFVQLPLASVTKLMMALVATELIPKDTIITINKDFLTPEGDNGLLVGEKWKFKELLDFSLLVSSNDGARSIASVAGATDLKSTDYILGRKNFILKMNLKAKEVGLRQTYYTNENGLDDGGLSGGYGSAIDVAKLVQYILANNPGILEVTKYKTVNISSLSKIHKAVNTNIDINKIPGLIASKTGFTDLAGGNLAVAFDSSIGHPIIIVVLGSTAEGRFKDVSTLVNASLEYISQQ